MMRGFITCSMCMLVVFSATRTCIRVEGQGFFLEKTHDNLSCLKRIIPIFISDIVLILKIAFDIESLSSKFTKRIKP